MAQDYETEDEDTHLKGIGGWLILMAIGQVLGPIQFLFAMISEYWSLPTGTFAAVPLAFTGDFLLRSAYLAILIYTAFLFFNKRERFPQMFIYSVVAGIAAPFAIGGWVSLASGVNTFTNFRGEALWTYLLGVAVGGIWIAYVLNSERVRRTFVE